LRAAAGTLKTALTGKQVYIFSCLPINTRLFLPGAFIMRISEFLLIEPLTSSFYLDIFLFLIVVSAFSLFFQFFLRSYYSKKSASFKYRTKDRFLSPAEHSFFLVLHQLLSDKYAVFPQVRIADVLQPKDKGNFSALNKITSKHFDFLLCDKQTLMIVAAVELDDQSHRRNDRIARDYFLNSACQSAGLQLIRFPCKSVYQLTEVREKIFNAIKVNP
jgi:hypothetical protein